MALEPIKIWELVDRAVCHKWSVPEFQRGFVWKATQVRDLAESLWLDFPVGSLLLWNSDTHQEERVAKDGVTPALWIVDGQQRTTALAILFGRKPYWWGSADDWNKIQKRYDIRFDVAAKASKNPGWVRDEFLPFLNDLADSGFHVDPNLLFQSLTAVGIKKVRFKEINDSFWNRDQIEPAWKKCREGWKRTIHRLQNYGVLSDDPLPTQAALVTLVALLDRFPQEGGFESAFYWFVQASRFGRYSGSSATSLEEDLKEVATAPNLIEAVAGLSKHLVAGQPIDAEEFKRDYSDGKFWRFLLYLLVYKNGAQDWDKAGTRLGFDGKELLADFRPQWHHIYPKKFLNKKVEPEKIDSLANIAVIGPDINIRISNQDPMKYLDKYAISEEKLRQQFVDWNRAGFTIDQYNDFLDARASRLASEANDYLLTLSKNLSESCRPNLTIAVGGKDVAG
jgi:hypothetical protein